MQRLMSQCDSVYGRNKPGDRDSQEGQGQGGFFGQTQVEVEKESHAGQATPELEGRSPPWGAPEEGARQSAAERSRACAPALEMPGTQPVQREHISEHGGGHAGPEIRSWSASQAPLGGGISS